MPADLCRDQVCCKRWRAKDWQHTNRLFQVLPAQPQRNQNQRGEPYNNESDGEPDSTLPQLRDKTAGRDLMQSHPNQKKKGRLLGPGRKNRGQRSQMQSFFTWDAQVTRNQLTEKGLTD